MTWSDAARAAARLARQLHKAERGKQHVFVGDGMPTRARLASAIHKMRSGILPVQRTTLEYAAASTRSRNKGRLETAALLRRSKIRTSYGYDIRGTNARSGSSEPGSGPARVDQKYAYPGRTKSIAQQDREYARRQRKAGRSSIFGGMTMRKKLKGFE